MTPPRGRAGRARPGGPTRGRSSFSPCLALRWCGLVHAVEVALERIDTLGPEPAELIQPVINLLEWLWLQAIQTALCVHRDSTKPASRSTRRCFDTAGCGIRSRRSISPTDCWDETRRLRIARRFGSAMIANADSMVLAYATGHILVKAYTEQLLRGSSRFWLPGAAVAEGHSP